MSKKDNDKTAVLQSSVSEYQELARRINLLSEFNTTSANDLALHFQTLISARESKVFMEAPGLYYPEYSIYVISKSGITRGHATMHKAIAPILPDCNSKCYAFVLYPGSLIRSCFDKVLRKTAKNIGKDLKLSMENVFNRKYHRESLVDSNIETELIELLKKDL